MQLAIYKISLALGEEYIGCGMFASDLTDPWQVSGTSLLSLGGDDWGGLDRLNNLSNREDGFRCRQVFYSHKRSEQSK